MNQTSSRRPRRSPKAWDEIVRRSEVTVLSQAEFCRVEGINLSTLYAWRKKCRSPGPKAVFLPVNLKPQTSPHRREGAVNADAPPAIEIVLASGHTIRVPSGSVDPVQLRMILRALGGAP